MVAEGRTAAARESAHTSLPGALSLRHVWVLLVLSAAFVGPASSPIVAPDAFWSLRRGAWMAHHGTLLTSDPFTSAPHVPGTPINVQWLADIAFFGLYRVGGLEGVIVGAALSVTLAYALVLAASVEASGRLRLSCLAVGVAYALGASNLTARPQTLAYPMFGLFVLVLARAQWRGDTRGLWVLPLVTALWANVHGSVFLGPLLLACATLGHLAHSRSLRASRAFAACLIGCGLGTVLTPYGLAGPASIVAVATHPIIREFVPEWAPTALLSTEGVLLSGLIVALVVLALRSNARLTLTELVTLIVFGILAFASIRAVVWFGVVSAPILARLLGGVVGTSQSRTRELPVVNTALVMLLLALCALGLPWTKSSLPFLPTAKRGLVSADNPIRAAAYLRDHDPPTAGRMFNYERWGGYLAWAVWPRHQAFIDGRFELYPPRVWLDYMTVVRADTNWRELLDTYAISYVVLSLAEQPELVASLRQEPGWSVVYEDDQAVVLERLLPAGV